MKKILFTALITFSSCCVFAGSAVFYVSPSGSDTATGTSDAPFATLEKARHTACTGPAQYVIIYLRQGTYRLDESLAFSPQNCPPGKFIRFEAYPGDLVTVSGAKKLAPDLFKPVTPDDTNCSRLTGSAKTNCLVTDMKKQGIEDFGKLRERGFFDKKTSHGELFFGSDRMTLARWPNDRFAWTARAIDSQTFEYSNETPVSKWQKPTQAWLYGMFMCEWAGRYIQIESVEIEKNQIRLSSAPPMGIGKGKPWFAVNVLEELDAPGEWFLDPDTAKLYFLPPADLNSAEISFSMLGEDGAPLVKITGASNITFSSIIFENCRSAAILIENGNNNVIDNCVIRNTGTAGVKITGGANNGLINSLLHNTADGAVVLNSGDRRTLTNSSNFVKNCHIHDTGDWTRTASPAVLLMGCGNIVSNNLIHDIPHSAIQYLFPPGGNNNLIEYNEIYNACYETDDAGAIYDAWDWGSRGHKIRYNFIHHIHSPEIKTEFGVQGIYFDGHISGYEVYGNIFYDIERDGITINGGRDHIIENNIFVKCENAIMAARSGTAMINEIPDNFCNALAGLRRFDYTNPPFSINFPRLLNIPNDYQDPYYEMAKEMTGTVVQNNIGWKNEHFLRQGHYPGGRILETFKTFKNNLKNTNPLFMDEQNLDLSLAPDSPAFALPGFQPIPFGKIATTPEPPKVTIEKGFHEDWQLDAIFIKGVAHPWCTLKSVRIIEMDQGCTRVISMKDNGMFSGLIPTVAINSKQVTVEVIVQDPRGRLSKPGISNTVRVNPDDSNLIGEVYIDPQTNIRMRGPVNFDPFVWPSEPPKDCPFPNSKDITGVEFLGTSITYTGADTWYPTWGRDGLLYSPWTDGKLADDFCQSGWADSVDADTGHAVIYGTDPLNLVVRSLGKHNDPAPPYGGRYPCGSLVHEGKWYHGSYCLVNKPDGYNWGTLGPFVGFRVSNDYGKTWTPCPHTPAEPLFGEHNRDGSGLKIGAPHFVDFGRNMHHSPDGKAYLIAHGAPYPDPKPRPANLSWITGDQIYLIRVAPSPGTINNPDAYEFFAGHNPAGEPIWTGDFEKIQPLIDWNNNCGCVTMTYNPVLKKYLMCVTDGWPTIKTMNTWIVESGSITGPWKLVTYMKDFGKQAYFVNIPTKFIDPDGRTAWLCYSGNFTRDQDVNPPGGSYGMSFQKIRLITP